ncbi:helicase-exonuclease AddAB subunit AddB [Clostridium sp. DL1XJH146]
MSLRFIYGRAGYGKTYFTIESIKKRIEKGEEADQLLLVPEQFSYTAEKTLVRELKGTGIINADVITFRRLFHKVVDEVGGDFRGHLNAAGKNMLIFSIMDRMKEEFNVFELAAKQEGFVDSISAIISEMKKYNITPLELVEKAERFKDEDMIKNKLIDISKIYEEFENKLHENYLDDDDDLTLLADILDKSTIFNNSEVWIDEFNSFTPQQYIIIEKIIKKAKRVNISLCTDYNNKINNSMLFDMTKRTENKLLEIVAENNVSIDKPIVLENSNKSRFSKSKDLLFLEENFHKYPAIKFEYDVDNISIYRGDNPYSEIEEVTKDILRLCRDENFRFRDIAVVSRDLNSYERIIKTTFEEYGIPVFIDKKKEIDDNPLIVIILSVIEIFIKNWSYDSVFRYLKSGLVDIEIEEIDMLENYVLEKGIRGKNRWSKEWDVIIEDSQYSHEGNISQEVVSDKDILTKEDMESEHGNINSTRKLVVEPLLILHEKIKGKNVSKDICRALYEFLIDIKAYEKIELLIEEFEALGEEELAIEYSQIWNLVMELLDQVVDIFGEEKTNLKDFVKKLKIGFNKHKMGVIPPALDVVLASSVDRIKNHQIKALYIVGVNDGVFPASVKEDSILTDGDREKLRELEINLAEDSKIKTFGEQFLVYTTLSLPSEYLSISYSASDFEGKSMRASAIIGRLKSLFPKINEKKIGDKDNFDELMHNVCAPIPTFNQMVSTLNKEDEEKQNKYFWEIVYKWFCSDELWNTKCSEIESIAAQKNTALNIDYERTKKIYGNEPYLSVSRLEKYVQCPYAYFVEYALKAKDRKIFKLNPPDIGSFMHGIIDDFSNLVREKELDWADLEENWCREKIHLLVERKINEISGSIFNSSSRYRYFTERLEKIIIRTILVVINHMKQSGFRPVGYEISFGGENGYSAIQVTLQSGEKVKLRGRIDRVDKATLEEGDYYRIIDYKSGTKDFSLNDLYYGLQIQLLTYLDAILSQDNNNGNNIMPAGMFYFKMDDPIIAGNREMNDEKIEKEILKSLKMKGLLLNDEKVVREMDKNIEGYSLIIPARMNKDGKLGKSSAISLQQFDLLREFVRDKIEKTCELMMRGEIEIAPYKNKDGFACKYCLYSSVCKFDSSLEENKFNILREKKEEEIWNEIKGEVEE